jgi:hypothetical protein
MDQAAKDRVAIARDALAWERAGALKVKAQSYIVVDGDVKTSLALNLDKQARDVVLGPCQVCALGGLLLAKAVRFDAVTVSNVLNHQVKRLLDHFSADQLNEIEAAFEGCSYPSITWIDSDRVFNIDWKEAFPNDKVRFRRIMENIIRNEGTFVPSDLG